MLGLLQHGTFRFRCDDENGGGVTLWFRLDDDSAEVGPIVLDRHEAELLASHVEGASALVEAALQRQQAAAAKAAEAHLVARLDAPGCRDDGSDSTAQQGSLRRLRLVRR